MEFRQVIRNKKLIIFANCLKSQQGENETTKFNESGYGGIFCWCCVIYKYSTQLTKHARVDCEGEDIIGKTYHKHSFLKDYRIQTETYH